MELNDLVKQLGQTFSTLIAEVKAIKDTLFLHKEAPQKWSIAEEIHHLSLSILPINNLLSQPELMIKRWGHSNRKSKSQEVFLQDYNEAVSGKEWKAFPPFVPKTENEHSNYAALHYTDNSTKIEDFYELTGEQIAFVRDQFQITLFTKKQDIIKTFEEQANLLLAITQQLETPQIDDLQLPLPNIGLVTFKEILYFTLNHTEHHFENIKKSIKQ